MNKELRGEVESQLGQKFQWKELEEGLNTIYIVSSGDEEYILKVHTNPKNEIEWFRAEPEIYDIISEETDTPSPEIVYRDVSEDQTDAFYLMKRIRGQNPNKVKEDLSQEQLGDILFQYGTVLGKIHSIKLSDQYGILGYEDGEFSPPEGAERWNWALEGSMNSWKDIIQEEWEDPPEIKYDAEEIKGIVPETPSPVLTHSDNRLDNLLIDGSEIKAFLDWSHPWSAHNEYDLARADYLLLDYDLSFINKEKSKRLREKLLEGYRQFNELDDNWLESDRRQIYRYANALWLAAGFANWGEKFDEEKHRKFRKDIVKRLEQESSILNR